MYYIQILESEVIYHSGQHLYVCHLAVHRMFDIDLFGVFYDFSLPSFIDCKDNLISTINDVNNECKFTATCIFLINLYSQISFKSKNILRYI